jgi:proteasome lid subunit RPN8/RPN11
MFGSAVDGLVEVIAVSGPGPNAVRSAEFYDAHLEHDLALAAQRPHDSPVVGVWHTHPAATRSPSEADLRSFRAWRSQVFKLDRLLAVIAVPPRDTWDFEAFTVTAGHGKDVASRAKLI